MENRKTSFLRSTTRRFESEPVALCAWIGLVAFVTISLASGPVASDTTSTRPTANLRTSLDEESMRPLDPPEPVLSRPFELRFEGDEVPSASTSRLLYADRRSTK